MLVSTAAMAGSANAAWRSAARCAGLASGTRVVGNSTVDEALANLREALELYFEDDEVPASFEHPLVTPIEIRIPA